MNESLKRAPEANGEQEDIKNLLIQHPKVVDFAVQNLSEDTKKGLEARFAQISEDEQKDNNRPHDRKHTEEEYEQIRRDVAREAVERDLLSLADEDLKRLNDDFANIDWDEQRDNSDKPKHTKEEYDGFRRDAMARALGTLSKESPTKKAEANEDETAVDATEIKVSTPEDKEITKTTIASIEGLNVTEATTKWLKGELEQIDWDEQKDYENPNKISHKHTREEYEAFRKEAVHRAIKKDLAKLSKEARQKIKDDTAQIKEDEKKDYENPFAISHKHTKEEYDRFRREVVANALLGLAKKPEATAEKKTSVFSEDLISPAEPKIVKDGTEIAIPKGDKTGEEIEPVFPMAPIAEALTESAQKGDSPELADTKKELDDIGSESEKLKAEIEDLGKKITELATESKPGSTTEKPEDEEAMIKAWREAKDRLDKIVLSRTTEEIRYDASKLLESLLLEPVIITEDVLAKIQELEKRNDIANLNGAVEAEFSTKQKKWKETAARLKKIEDNEKISDDIREKAHELTLALLNQPVSSNYPRYVDESLLEQIEELEKRAANEEDPWSKIFRDTDDQPKKEDEEKTKADKEAELAGIDEELAKIDTELADMEKEKKDNDEAAELLSKKRRNLDKQVDIIDSNPLLAVDVDVTRDRNTLADRLARKVEAFRSRKKSLMTRIWRTKLFPRAYSEDIAKEFANNERTAEVGGEKLTVNELLARKSKGLIRRFTLGAVDSMQGLRNQLDFDERITEADQETTDKVRAAIEEYVDKRPKDGENLDDLKRELSEKVRKIVTESLRKGKKDGLSVGNYEEVAETAYQRYNDYVEAATQSRCKAEHDLAMAAVMTGFRLFFGEAHDSKMREEALAAVESVE